MLTAAIVIGNSDNKLSQSEWSHFVHAMRNAVEKHAHEVHFSGGSDWDAPWQNACWVCNVLPGMSVDLELSVAKCRASFNQDAAAMIWGESVML